MVLPQGVSVAHRDQRDAAALHVRVQVALYVNGYSAGALVQDGVDRLVVDQTRHGNALLLATRQDIIPVVLSAPATLAADQVAQLDLLQDLLQVLQY